MANSRICAVLGCGKRAHGRGFCGTHYMRWKRHGTPLGGGTYNGEPIWFLENIAMNYAANDCLPWPYARNASGYGNVFVDGITTTASRFLCQRTLGQPPSPEHEAAHSCGNGHLGCVNPKHLRWATVQENQMEAVEHLNRFGDRTHQHKITNDQVRQIREAYAPSMSRGQIVRLRKQQAKEFDTTYSYIKMIHLGLSRLRG